MSPSMPLRALGLAACCAAQLTVTLAGVDVVMSFDDTNRVVTMSHAGGTGDSADPRWLSLGIGMMADGKCVLIDGMGDDQPTEWTLAGHSFASMTLVQTSDLKGQASFDNGKRSLSMTVPIAENHVIIGVGIPGQLDFDKSNGHRAEMTVMLAAILRGGALAIMPPVTQQGSQSTTINIAGTSVELSNNDSVVTASHTGHAADPRWVSLGTGKMASGRCVIVDGAGDDSLTEWTLAGLSRAQMTKVDDANATLEGGESVQDGRKSVSIRVPDSEAHVILAVGPAGQLTFEGSGKHQAQTTVQLADIGNGPLLTRPTVLVFIHAVFGLLAWMVLAPIGVAIASAAGPSFATGYNAFNRHRIVFSAVVLVTIVVVVLQLATVGLNKDHGIIALVLMVLAVLNAAGGTQKPGKKHPNRKKFNFLHAFSGRAAGGLAFAVCATGVTESGSRYSDSTLYYLGLVVTCLGGVLYIAGGAYGFDKASKRAKDLAAVGAAGVDDTP